MVPERSILGICFWLPSANMRHWRPTAMCLPIKAVAIIKMKITTPTHQGNSFGDMKDNPIIKIVNFHVIDYPTPVNLSYW
jgi:hypothetical protein